MIRYAADEAVDRAPCLTGPLFLEATKKRFRASSQQNCRVNDGKPIAHGDKLRDICYTFTLDGSDHERIRIGIPHPTSNKCRAAAIDSASGPVSE